MKKNNNTQNKVRLIIGIIKINEIKLAQVNEFCLQQLFIYILCTMIFLFFFVNTFFFIYLIYLSIILCTFLTYGFRSVMDNCS